MTMSVITAMIMAKNYYVTGKSGEAKKINLPRDLVIWE